MGLNYVDHAAESGMPLPAQPILFMKATTAICGPDDDVIIPKGSFKTDWEVELGVVIGAVARHVTVDAALDHVAVISPSTTFPSENSSLNKVASG